MDTTLVLYLHYVCCRLFSSLPFSIFLSPTLPTTTAPSFPISTPCYKKKYCLLYIRTFLLCLFIVKAEYPRLFSSTTMEPLYWDCIRHKYRQLGCKSSVRVASDTVYRLEMVPCYLLPNSYISKKSLAYFVYF